jgi:hypothetical protein
MTENPDSPPDRSGSPSFTATSTDQARTYQASRDQTINEHHHYTPRDSLRTGMAWSLAGVTVLTLGAFVGVDLWQRHTAADTTPVGDAKAPAFSTASTPSATPKQSGTAPESPPPARPPVQRHSTAPTAGPTPSASASALPANPNSCTSKWSDPGVARVQVRPCGRVENGHLYAGAEWRTTSSHALVDIYIWLEDAKGTTVVYPGKTMEYGMPYFNMAAWPEPQIHQQWKEFEVGPVLEHGELYQVCVEVREHGDTDKPNISSPAVKGFQYGILYT